MQRLIDAGVLGVLVFALLLVVLVDKLLSGRDTSDQRVISQPANVTPFKVATRPLRLAVTDSQKDKDGRIWDDMGKLLSSLGEGYQFTQFHARQLLDGKKMADFDVLFLTCAPGGADPIFDGTPLRVEPAFAENLRNFVAQGGTLYASDWRYDALEAAFPDVASLRLKDDGRAQSVTADVVDPGLRDMLQLDTVPLNFDLDKWKTAAFAGDRVKVLIEGKYQRQRGGVSRAPLLVRFQFGKGTVIFTSFHNERQNSVIEQQLLKYLVFSAVTAQIDNQVNRTLIEGGFAPQKQNLLSATKDNPQVTYTYQSTKAGKIQFVLGFQDRGAKLRLAVVSPGGKKTEHVGTSTFAIEETSTGPGEWRYTVTAIERPFDEFPFTVTVAESEGP
ncbi:MAG: hypothetical protein L0Y71_05205 [Gemmataceae bacterium]|nr:hypothetical protein [Gemmataceae bacterium]